MANPETGYFTGNTTAVNSVRQEEFGAQSIYTLQGKRVKSAWQHLPAGVYVVNGKKVIKWCSYCNDGVIVLLPFGGYEMHHLENPTNTETAQQSHTTNG